jgi:hypothetical protein
LPEIRKGAEVRKILSFIVRYVLGLPCLILAAPLYGLMWLEEKIDWYPGRKGK